MELSAFAATLGNVVWEATVADPPVGGYSDGGVEAALVDRGGQYKLVTTPYSNDPWRPAGMGPEECAEALASPWLDREMIRSRIIAEFEVCVSGQHADAGYLTPAGADGDDDDCLWPAEAASAALAAAGCEPDDEPDDEPSAAAAGPVGIPEEFSLLAAQRGEEVLSMVLRFGWATPLEFGVGYLLTPEGEARLARLRTA